MVLLQIQVDLHIVKSHSPTHELNGCQLEGQLLQTVGNLLNSVVQSLWELGRVLMMN